MQLLAPVPRHASSRAGYRLIRGMCVRQSKPGAIAKLPRPVVVEPVLSGFETLNHGMTRRMIVGRRVTAGRRVAATDVPALRTTPKMQPPATGFEAFDTTVTAGRNARVDAVHFGPFAEISRRSAFSASTKISENVGNG